MNVTINDECLGGENNQQIKYQSSNSKTTGISMATGNLSF
jgi:hypothetical protein